MTTNEKNRLLEAINNLAGEHCRSFIFYAEVEDDECTPEVYGAGGDTHSICSIYNGGIPAALGLAEIARLDLAHEFMQGDEEDRGCES